jgi:hypothetical protein
LQAAFLPVQRLWRKVVAPCLCQAQSSAAAIQTILFPTAAAAILTIFVLPVSAIAVA